MPTYFRRLENNNDDDDFWDCCGGARRDHIFCRSGRGRPNHSWWSLRRAFKDAHCHYGYIGYFKSYALMLDLGSGSSAWLGGIPMIYRRRTRSFDEREQFLERCRIGAAQPLKNDHFRCDDAGTAGL